MKNRSGFFLILIISFFLIILAVFQFNKINKKKIKTEFEKLTIAEGLTIKSLIETSGTYILEHGEDSLKKFLLSLYKNKSIIYIGLLKNSDLIYLLSRYDGFFPVASGKEGYRFLDSPVGKIFEIGGVFKKKKSDDFGLYIGFNYKFLTSFERTVGRNFFLITGIILFIIIFIVIIILSYDKKFFLKNLELIREKEEKERFKDLSLLTSEIAHEIKNPLNSIYLSFNTMEQYLADNEDAVFYKNAVKNEIKRISEIINSYSELSKDIKIKNNKISIDEFISEFKLIKKDEFKEKNIEFIVESGSFDFVTDKDLLKQILFNLINNAVEAEAKKISLLINKRNRMLNITLEDNGSGIRTDLRDSIFKPYISSKTGGMGLGLYITKKMVEALNGSIELFSGKPGKKIFKITLKEGKQNGRKI